MQSLRTVAGCGGLSLIALLLVSLKASGQGPGSDVERLRALLAWNQRVALATGAVNLHATLSRYVFSADAVLIEEIKLPCPPLKVWRVRSTASTDAPVLVGSLGARMYPLGGFEAPEIISLSTAVSRTPSGRHCLDAGVLTRLLDPFGALDVRREMTDESGARLAIDTWLRLNGQPSWPTDATHQDPSGRSVQRVTVLSREHSGYSQLVPILYVFAFDSVGAVASWRRVVGTIPNEARTR